MYLLQKSSRLTNYLCSATLASLTFMDIFQYLCMISCSDRMWGTIVASVSSITASSGLQLAILSLIIDII